MERKKIKIIAAIAAISFVQGLQYCVAPVLDQIQKHYSTVSISLVQMLVTVPSLLSILVALISGGLVMKVSKKKLLLFGALVAGITGLIPFLSDHFGLLFVSRLAYGIGLGLACTLNTAVVAEFFAGDERVAVMGIQSASIGAGMVIVTTLGGSLGAIDFRLAYLVNIIAFLSFAVIAFCLPDTGKTLVTGSRGIKLTKEVFIVSWLGMLELLFLITFTTNIAMHLSGSLTGNTAVSGVLTGLFSAAQIVMGLILRSVTKVTGKYTLPAAMLCFCAGALLLIGFSDNYLYLSVGAVLCGFSQGMFIPQAMCDVSAAVEPASTTMAAACFTCFNCFGQIISPTVLNMGAQLFFGQVSTTNVYILAAGGMALSAAAAAMYIKSRR